MAIVTKKCYDSKTPKLTLFYFYSSSPETIGTATVHLVELLSHNSLDGVSVLIVFSKADLQSPRNLQEFKSILRFDQIQSMGNQDIQDMTCNMKKRDTLAPIFDWCMKFQTPSMEMM